MKNLDLWPRPVCTNRRWKAHTFIETAVTGLVFVIMLTIFGLWLSIAWMEGRTLQACRDKGYSGALLSARFEAFCVKQRFGEQVAVKLDYLERE